MKRLLVFALALLGIGCLAVLPVQAQKAEKTNWPFGFHLTLHTSQGNKLSGFPERIRDVPLHEDDDYLAYDEHMLNPMPDTLLTLDKPQALELQATFNPNPYWLLGVAIAHRTADAGKDSKFRYQQNQWGDSSREYGASLRWYETGVKPLQLGLIGMLTTPWQSFSRPYIKTRLLVGGVYDLTGLRIKVQGGWDRWGGDEEWDDEVLLTLYEHRFQLGFEVGFLEPKKDGEAKDLISVQLFYVYPLDRLKVSAKAPDLQFDPMDNPHRVTLLVGASI